MLEKFKEAVYCATVVIKDNAKFDKLAKTNSERLYWAMLLWRAARSGQPWLIAKAVGCSPELSAMTSEDRGSLWDRKGLIKLIVELQDEDLQQQIELTAGEQQQQVRANRLAKLLNQRRLWATTGKTLCLQAIMGEDGGAASGEQAAKELARHWGGSLCKVQWGRGCFRAVQELCPDCQQPP